MYGPTDTELFNDEKRNAHAHNQKFKIFIQDKRITTAIKEIIASKTAYEASKYEIYKLDALCHFHLGKHFARVESISICFCIILISLIDSIFSLLVSSLIISD